MKCSRCTFAGLTWAEAKRSFGRMVRAGLTVEEAKQHSPLCGKHTTAVLVELGIRPYRERWTGPPARGCRETGRIR